ncbi:hypothetical protein QFZ81_003664 [Paenibacillus sp. V4I9]|uniref:hypothetical protein n=1 Tax=Paenibacillus sp. V4I9 TaxID=3042308 RepID=UPI00277E93DC|nr:hypothetical protein [Paenibacillus sp. V4I9]MDQ0888576.1 hypothetical protein [Paenibacillus sp. V4I9]
MIKHNRLILLILVIVIGFAVWQSYQLSMKHKAEKLHIAHTALRTANFFHTIQQSIESINNKNEWDNIRTRDFLRVWLSYTNESIINTNSTLGDFQSLVSFKSRQNMNDISFQYSEWWTKVANILDKSSPLTSEDKTHITKLSKIVSKVDGIYPHDINDWEGIWVAFSRLNEEWKKHE